MQSVVGGIEIATGPCKLLQNRKVTQENLVTKSSIDQLVRLYIYGRHLGIAFHHTTLDHMTNHYIAFHSATLHNITHRTPTSKTTH